MVSRSMADFRRERSAIRGWEETGTGAVLSAGRSGTRSPFEGFEVGAGGGGVWAITVEAEEETHRVCLVHQKGAGHPFTMRILFVDRSGGHASDSGRAYVVCELAVLA